MSKTRGFEICNGYEEKGIEPPKRETKYAVGYDLSAAEDMVIPSIWRSVFENIRKFLSGKDDYVDIKPTAVFTGIKAYFGPDEVLIIANRSSGPSKKGLILANSIGVVDSDYYSNPSNDGNIIFQFYNIFPFDAKIAKGDRIGQAYFQKFLIADDDKSEGERQGGIGSTGR